MQDRWVNRTKSAKRSASALLEAALMLEGVFIGGQYCVVLVKSTRVTLERDLHPNNFFLKRSMKIVRFFKIFSDTSKNWD